jgi:hypothetical protein
MARQAYCPSPTPWREAGHRPRTYVVSYSTISHLEG